ncbi:anaphase promoting complex subunit morula [Tachypleus tridentatus]|uniref:anaphase promoting complex subunit morula n=1 Tax=Tachypleus tridentatus TaxID=6853 RepID=UPI003FD067D0
MSEALETLSVAWNVISKAFRPALDSGSNDEYLPSYEDLKASVELLHQHGIAHIVEEWFFETLQQDLREIIVPRFWSHFDFKTVDASGNPDTFFGSKYFLVLLHAVKELHSSFQLYIPCVSQLQCLHEDLQAEEDTLPTETRKFLQGSDLSLASRVHLVLKALLLAKLPQQFSNNLIDFYSRAFKAFQIKQPLEKCEEEDLDDQLECSACENDNENCCCVEVLNTFQEVNQHLKELNILEAVAGDAVTTVAYRHIKDYVQKTCKGNYENSYLPQLERWLDGALLMWMQSVYSESNAEYVVLICNIKEQMNHFLYETYTTVRTEELFSIIIEFPESQAALEDLKVCLEKTNLRQNLITSLKNSLERRLLHPGVNTADILTAYISAIKALRILDPTGVILQLVCEPVRKYLRLREDTVRCIVSSLTDDGCGELASELMKGAPLLLDDNYQADEESVNWESWQPDPSDADPTKTTQSHRSHDIISMLVSIYGSKDLFVKEYCVLLADRLLSTFCYDTVREIRYLELLKLRFGESQLHQCEVMLKDVADSKRINAHVNSEKMVADFRVGEFPLNAMILSAQFWPTLREEHLQLPEIVEKALDSYKKAFEALKGNRTLCWKGHLGLVNLDLQLKDRTLNFSVSPIHATIIWHFQEKARWSLEALSGVTRVPTSALRRKIAYWQTLGILREEATDVFVLEEEEPQRQSLDGSVLPDEEEENGSVMASSQDQREEELQVFWSFIVGMLTNLGSLPIERIHSMLRMFAMQGSGTTGCSIHELRQFLDRKVHEQKLVYSGGYYRLPRV